MANQLTPIASTVLLANAASVSFASISSAYTDLVLRVSVRTNTAGTNSGQLKVNFNSDVATNYSITLLYGDGSSAVSQRTTGGTYIQFGNGAIDSAGSTANTFSCGELYIPNYGNTTNRPMSAILATENNASAALLESEAWLYRGASAISSIQLINGGADSFVIGSRFDLYGILHA